jgi:hypothetical protein
MEVNKMIRFINLLESICTDIKWNWKNYLVIAACIAAVVALNAHVLHVTRGAYNLFEILFI